MAHYCNSQLNLTELICKVECHHVYLTVFGREDWFAVVLGEEQTN